MQELDKASPPEPIEIPIDRLDEETLRRIVEEFVLREGTDYGLEEVRLDTKISQVMKQVTQGDVRVFFDPESESVTLLKTKNTL